MSGITGALGTLVKSGAALWNRIKNPQTETIKLIIKSLNKGTKHFLSYLSTKTEQDEFEKTIYWEEEKLKQYFEKKYSEDRGFGFHIVKAEDLAKDIEPYLILSNHHLTLEEKTAHVEKIIFQSQREYIIKQSNDNKTLGYLDLRGKIKIEKIIEMVSLLPSIQEDLEQIKQQLDIIEDGQEREGVKDYRYYYKLCIQLFEEGNYLDCLSTVQIALRLELSTEQYIFMKFIETSIYYNQFNYDLALSRILEIENKFDYEISNEFVINILGQKGSIYSEKGVKEKNAGLVRLGIECFEEQLTLIDAEEEQESKLGYIYYNMGTSYLSILETQNDIDCCIRYFELAHELLPGNAEVMKNLGTAYSFNHQYEQEIEMYEKALVVNPELFEALCAMGMVYYAYLNQPEEAIKYYSKAIKQREQCIRFPYAYYWIGKCYFEMNLNEDAITTINDGLGVAPTLEHLLHLKSEVLYKLLQENSGKYLSEYFQVMKRLYPEPTEESASKLIAALLLCNKDEEAQQLLFTFSKEIREGKEMMPSYFMWTFKCIEKNDFDEAYQVIQNINPDIFDEEIKPFKDYYHFIMAKCLGGLDRSEEGIKHLEILHDEASIFTPVQTHSLLGGEYNKVEDFNNARIHFQRAKSILGENNTDMDIEYGLFQAYLGLKRVRPAKLAMFRMIDLISVPYVGGALFDRDVNEPKLKSEAESESTAIIRVAEIMMGIEQLAYLQVDIKHKESLAELPEAELVQEINRFCEPLVHYFSNKLVSTTLNFNAAVAEGFLSKMKG
ncbi:tetratricopeptide repeat protein [Paenibacillus sp. FSL R7-0210]|uniref:tetratricopeptide repeat protein n=1 Tax=Paenibacillus sp. FSL R7-0210 TaxID=2921676 RepID=UPI0030FAC443